MESIWFLENPDLDYVNNLSLGTMLETLDIKLTNLTHNELTGTMPVDHRTIQPAGLMHGGASCVLAESLGSIASHLVVDNDKKTVVGQSLFTNHIRPGKPGDLITGKAKPVHLGRKSHIWEIELTNQEQKLVSINRLTVAIIDKN